MRAFSLEHARDLHPAHVGEFQLVLADRPLVVFREGADHQHHRMRLLEPVFHPALLLDRENLRAVGLAFREMAIARLQLQVEPAPGAFAVVIGEFQLHIQPLVLRGRISKHF